MFGILKELFKDEFEEWVKSATDDELDEGYEERRVKWNEAGLNTGPDSKTYEMKRISREISRRSAEKWEKDPRRNTDPAFRWTDKNRWEKD